MHKNIKISKNITGSGAGQCYMSLFEAKSIRILQSDSIKKPIYPPHNHKDLLYIEEVLTRFYIVTYLIKWVKPPRTNSSKNIDVIRINAYCLHLRYLNADAWFFTNQVQHHYTVTQSSKLIFDNYVWYYRFRL